jgi:hypothetical protein
VLEQIVFTDLRLPAHIADADLAPAVDARNYRWVQHLADPVDSRGLSISWEEGVLPPGFHMTVSARQVLRSGPVEHLVFSDGLAAVSVFVEMTRGAAGDATTEDAATIGSSSAYSTVVQGYRVTAVGEVPPDTVRAIARSIRAAVPAPESASASASVSASVSAPSMSQPLLGLGISPLPTRLTDSSASIFGEQSANPGAGSASDMRGLGTGRASSGLAAPGSFGVPGGAGIGGGPALGTGRR